MNLVSRAIWAIFFLANCHAVYPQDYWSNIRDREPTLGLDKGIAGFTTGKFHLKLVNASQTVAALSPVGEPGFDFTPGDRLEIRDKDSLYQLGDINLRMKQGGNWRDYSTAWHRSPVEALEVTGPVLAAADLSNSLPPDIPVRIRRFYETAGDDLIIRFQITNETGDEVEIGGLGVPMIFNNILEGRSLEEAHARNVFFDPYIGRQAGYLEIRRLSGRGPALLVLPEENMAFEAYRPLLDDPTRRSVVFEGFHEWMPYSLAYARNEWKGVEQWNTPTSLSIGPGASKTISLRFVLAAAIQDVEDTLIARDRPVVTGVPGYVLPMDVNGRLFITYHSGVKALGVEPEGALEVTTDKPAKGGRIVLNIRGREWGRARLTIIYEDGMEQTVHYKVVDPEPDIVRAYGRFLMTEQWFSDKNDPFRRAPSVMSYDHDTGQKVVQDGRVWIAGLSDEGGAGSWLGAMMKQLVLPDKEEISRLEGFIDTTLWGGIQYSGGQNQYGVRKSVFFYEPDSMPPGTYDEGINYKTWAAWNKKGADDPGRSYNYPHVAAAYWVMYRLARYHTGLVDNKPWDWYLNNAYHTAMAMTRLAPHYAQFGQMEGTIFLLILEDLEREGLTRQGNDLEQAMNARAQDWRSLSYPFGSEMPWDSTGQEEVYMWSDYFGFNEKAAITLNAILAYMPSIPHWAYNGSARRYWDFLYAGKLTRVERQLHHYGSALNAIPVLKAYRNDPGLYLLRVGYGGLLGGISNITRDGFGPSAFHSFPSTLEIDGLSGDYGSGFFGYAINTGTYITRDEDLGWLAFGGNLSQEDHIVHATITTAGKNRIFLAPRNLWLTLDAGTFKSLGYNEENGEVSLVLNPKDAYTPIAFLRVEGDAALPYEKVRGAYKILLGPGDTRIVF